MKELIAGLFVASLLLFILAFVFFKSWRKERAESRKLRKNMEQLRGNIAYLFRHSTELAQIDEQMIETEQEIRKAKNEDELIQIINGIVKSNNDRVRDNKKK